MSLTITNPTSDYSDWDWYAHPKRGCANDQRYEDLLLVPSKKERKRMIATCLVCPVYYECLEDLLKYPKSTHYGIRAGIQGRT